MGQGWPTFRKIDMRKPYDETLQMTQTRVIHIPTLIEQGIEVEVNEENILFTYPCKPWSDDLIQVMRKEMTGDEIEHVLETLSNYRFGQRLASVMKRD
jgi:hypothetical protein